MKTRISLLALTISLGFLFSGCYVNLKSKIDKPVTVEISDNLPVVISNTGNTNFSGNITQEQYVEAFMLGLKGELGGTENVTIVASGGQYLVTFEQLKVDETTKIEKIDDKDSEDHGKEFELTSLDFAASGNVVRVSDGSTRSWTAYKDKDESTTNSRSAGQVLTGDNKDKTEYREKEFDDGTAEDLAQKTGRRSGVVIVRDIGQLMK